MDEHGLLDGPGVAVDLFVYYIKLFWILWVSCGGAVKVYRGGGFEVFLDSFSQWSTWFSYIGTGAIYLGAFVVINDACMVVLGVLVFGVS